MKRAILLGFVILSCSVFAQQSGMFNIYVIESSYPAQGTAVFFFEDADDLEYDSSSQSYEVKNYSRWAYTNNSGTVRFPIVNKSPTDTLAWAIPNCQGDWLTGENTVQNLNNTTVTEYLSCDPLVCDAWTYAEFDSSNTTVTGTAIPLRDPNYLSSTPGNIINQWIFTDSTGKDTLTGTNITYAPSSFTSGRGPGISSCFTLYSSCNPRCDSVETTPFICEPHFYVDTVNSVNFQGQIILWENSTTPFGTIIDYHWDFGDGSTANTRYPTHTYSDTNVYNVCLTTTAVARGDTSVYTFCDSVGFDDDGKLVYKNGQTGFTINVFNPQNVGQEENTLRSEFSLYPNPTDDEAILRWPSNLDVKYIDIISINGQRIKRIEPRANLAAVNNLRSGVYVVKIRSRKTVTSLQLIIE